MPGRGMPYQSLLVLVEDIVLICFGFPLPFPFSILADGSPNEMTDCGEECTIAAEWI